MKVLDLFSGIGGFSLGLELTGGFETVAFCEIDPYCQEILRMQWPDVPIFSDIQELTNDTLKECNISPDIIVGGFPCQNISTAGKGEGIIGERSGLWKEMFRLIRDVRPAWAVIENVSALRSKGLVMVLEDLSSLGYISQWHCISASSIGAPHQRDRIWITAHRDPNNESQSTMPEYAEAPGLPGDVAYTDTRCDRENQKVQARGDAFNSSREDVAHTRLKPTQVQTQGQQPAEQEPQWPTPWEAEPSVGRVVDGLPNRMDRLKALGNAVVPQIPYAIGRAILEVIDE